MASCSTCGDVTRELGEIRKELARLRGDVNSNYFKLNNNLNGLAGFLGKGKVNWIEMATMIASILSVITGIAIAVKAWVDGAYLPKILEASNRAAEKANNAQYAAEVSSLKLNTVLKNQTIIQEKANNAEYAATQASLRSQSIQSFLSDFGSSTAENFRVIQQEFYRLSALLPSKELLSGIARRIRLLIEQPYRILQIEQRQD